MPDPGGAPVRGMRGMTCRLDPGHKRTHSINAYVCDGCGKNRRGYPHYHGETWDGTDTISLCFMCAGPVGRGRYEEP